MAAQVKAWGNGQEIRFSKELPDTLGIHVNGCLKTEAVNGDTVFSKTFRHKTLEERTAECGGKIGPYEELEWPEAEDREVW